MRKPLALALPLLVCSCEPATEIVAAEPCHLLLDPYDGANPAGACAVRRVQVRIEDDQPRLDAADLDGDGLPELLLAGDIFEYRRLGEWLGELTLDRNAIPLPEGIGPHAWRSPTVADLDGNGVLDALARPWGEWQHASLVMHGDGTGKFGAPLPLHPLVDELGPVPFDGFDQIDAGDVNGDGRADLFGLYGDWYFTVAPGEEGGGFAPPTHWYAPIDAHSFLVRDVPHFRSADLNGDGRQDAVLGMRGALVTLLGSESGFEGGPISRLSDRATMQNVLALADFDGDGALDALVQPTNEDMYPFGVLFVHRGDGKGGFERWQEVDVPGGVTIRAADFDADGKADILLGAHRNKLWALGFDEGRWRTLFSVRGQDDSFLRVVQDFVVDDLDGDGDRDLAWLTHMPDDYTRCTLEVLLVSREHAAESEETIRLD